MSKTATGLVAYAKAQLGKPYWYACFGNKPTPELLDYKIKQYPAMWTPATRVTRAKTQHIGKFDRVHDCIGLVKGYLWSETPTAAPKYNAAQDVSANGMRGLCKAGSKIGTLPETPGALVFLDGHVGVYIGGGQVVEARGSDYGVVQTALKARPWTHWGLCPWVEYGNQESGDRNQGSAEKPADLKPGDIVRFSKIGVPYGIGMVNIPVRLAGDVFRVDGKSRYKDGQYQVRLLEINTWCAVENLEKVVD